MNIHDFFMVLRKNIHDEQLKATGLTNIWIKSAITTQLNIRSSIDENT